LLEPILPISNFELFFRIGATSLQREGTSIWHGLTWTSRGRYEESSLVVVSLMKSESLASGGVMTMTPMSNLFEDPTIRKLAIHRQAFYGA
jgi:hypothetical protein